MSPESGARGPVALLIPGAIDTPTGGYRYDRHVVAGLRAAGHDVTVIEVGGGFPLPSDDDITRLQAMIEAQASDRVLLVDGLVYSATADAAAAIHALGHPVIALIHHPLSLEAGLATETAERLRTSEFAALARAKSVIVTSPETRAILVRDFGVPADHIAVALPGVDRRPVPQRPQRARKNLLTVASFIPRKGYLDLIAAYARIADLDWQATLIGGMSYDPPHVVAIGQAIDDANLSDRITLIGDVGQAELEAHYADADLFVLPTHYEGYGMAFAEAIVRGLGVIGTTGAPNAIGDGGDMVTPGDVDGLVACLRRAIATPDGLERLRVMAAKRAPDLPDWQSTAHIFADLVNAVAR
jgi:glycosyltransferase involved in cell wall biosynthesis